MNAEKYKYTLINTCSYSALEDDDCVSYPSTVSCLRPKNVCILHDEGVYKHLYLYNIIFGNKAGS